MDLNNPDEVKKQQDWYQRLEAHYETQLRSGSYASRLFEVKRQSKKIDKDLEEKKTISVEPVLTPDKRTRTQEATIVLEPGAMDKVKAELKKQDLRNPLDAEIKYEATKKILEDKNRDLEALIDKEDKQRFRELMGVDNDEALIKAHEAKTARKENMLDRDLTDEKGNQIWDETGVKGVPKVTFNEQELEAEHYFNRSATIKHYDQIWHYQRLGTEETFSVKDQEGKPVVELKKLDQSKDFDDGRNTYVESKYGKASHEKKAYALEHAMETWAPEAEKLLQKEKSEKLTEEFGKALVKDKAKVDFNRAAGNNPPPPGSEDPHIDPNDPDPSPTDGEAVYQSQEQDIDLGDDHDWLSARLDEPYTANDYEAEYGEPVERSADKSIDLEGGKADTKFDKGMDME